MYRPVVREHLVVVEWVRARVEFGRRVSLDVVRGVSVRGDRAAIGAPPLSTTAERRK